MLGYCKGYRDNNPLIITVEIPNDSVNNLKLLDESLNKSNYRTNKVKIIKIEDIEGNEYQNAKCNFGYINNSNISSCYKDEIIENNYTNISNTIGIKFYLDKEQLKNILINKYSDSYGEFINLDMSDYNNTDIEQKIPIIDLPEPQITSELEIIESPKTVDDSKLNSYKNFIKKKLKKIMKIIGGEHNKEVLYENDHIQTKNIVEENNESIEPEKIIDTLKPEEILTIMETLHTKELKEESKKTEIIENIPDNILSFGNTELFDDRNMQYILGITTFTGIVALLYSRYK